MARILLVDDEVTVGRGLSEYLTRSGHEVRLATNGLEAIEALQESATDVVVTDINMPDMDGIELILALREADSQIGLIAMSGGGLFPKDLLLDSAAALGADVTLQKPMDLGELRAAIDEVFREVSVRAR